MVKKPNKQEADQMAIYERGRGLRLKQSSDPKKQAVKAPGGGRTQDLHLVSKVLKTTLYGRTLCFLLEVLPCSILSFSIFVVS